MVKTLKINNTIHIMNKKDSKSESKYQIKVLNKVFRLLDLFNNDVDEELTVPEITERLGYNQPTVFRIISNLEEEGYLDKDQAAGKYRLGMKLYFLGNRVKPYRFLKTTARPLLSMLNQKTGETVHLAVLHRYQVLYLDKIEGNHSLRVVVSQVGSKLPAHCSGVGKVLLSNLTQDELKEVVNVTGLPAFTGNTITSMSRLQKEIDKIRKQGFGIDNEEIELGLSCVAAPVFAEGQLVAALSVSLPKERFDRTYESLSHMVVQTAKDLSIIVQTSIGNFRPQWLDT